MSNEQQTGLGELLRHLTELVDGGAEAAYRERGIDYKPRYTPIMRALSQGAATVSDITTEVRISQSAVSQTIKLMEKDGLIVRQTAGDARSQFIAMTSQGKNLLVRLEEMWGYIFAAIADLETETGFSLLAGLDCTVSALETQSFEDRISNASRAPQA